MSPLPDKDCRICDRSGSPRGRWGDTPIYAANWLIASVLWWTLPAPSLASTLPPTSSDSSQSLPDAIFTRQRAFTIPFTVNPREGPLTEVRLYVSADASKTWQYYQRQAPQANGFQFRATQDGDYCFAVWTGHQSAATDPPAENAPDGLKAELRVIVDTSLPELDFTVTLGRGGELRAEWTASDNHLAEHPIRVEYRSGASSWKQVTVPPPSGPPTEKIQGEVSWWPDDSSDGSVDVRAILDDRAGNTRQVVQRVAVAQRLPSPPDEAPPAATLPPSVPAPSANTNVDRPLESWEPTRTADLPQPHLSSGWVAQNPAQAAGPEPAAESLLMRLPKGDGVREKSNSRYETAPTPTVADTWSSPSAPLHPPLANNFEHSQLPVRSLPTQSVEGTADRHASPVEGESAGQDTADTSANTDVRLCTSRTFDLTYDLRDLAPSAARKVDLWWTLDDGATWRIYDTDADCKSPMRVQVQREGRYGFRLVVHSRDGLSGSQPQAGDRPDFDVLTDWTRPTAEITGVEFGQGQQQGHLIIRWTAHDLHWGAGPVQLEYSSSVSGPWHTIATSLDPNGQFVWRMDPNVPGEILVRLQATDRVGNRTTFMTQHPIRTGGLCPQVQILELRPVDDAAAPPTASFGSSDVPSSNQ